MTDTVTAPTAPSESQPIAGQQAAEKARIMVNFIENKATSKEKREKVFCLTLYFEYSETGIQSPFTKNSYVSTAIEKAKQAGLVLGEYAFHTLDALSGAKKNNGFTLSIEVTSADGVTTLLNDLKEEQNFEYVDTKGNPESLHEIFRRARMVELEAKGLRKSTQHEAFR